MELMPIIAAVAFAFGSLCGFMFLYAIVCFKSKRVERSLRRNPVPNPILAVPVPAIKPNPILN